MLRSLTLSAAVLAGALAQVQPSATPVPYPCRFNSTKSASTMCPGIGQPCSNTLLCSKGLYCKANRVGQGGASSYTGVCATTPDIMEVRNAAARTHTVYGCIIRR